MPTPRLRAQPDCARTPPASPPRQIVEHRDLTGEPHPVICRIAESRNRRTTTASPGSADSLVHDVVVERRAHRRHGGGSRRSRRCRAPRSHAPGLVPSDEPSAWSISSSRADAVATDATDDGASRQPPREQHRYSSSWIAFGFMLRLAIVVLHQLCFTTRRQKTANLFLSQHSITFPVGQ